MGSRQIRSVTLGKRLALKFGPLDLLSVVRSIIFACFFGGSFWWSRALVERVRSKAKNKLLRTGADKGNPTV